MSSKWLVKHWQLIVYVLFGAFIRLWNLTGSQYFIYDQGRDAMALEKIIHGHFLFVCPTTGLGGLFLGPLWFYFNTPIFWLSHGNPYIVAAWDIAFSCLALPLFWWMAHILFKEKKWAVLTAILLAIIPCSVSASVFVWNP